MADSLLNHTGVGTVINQTITGMGGIGKTQLAVEFAYRYGRYFRGVHWLNLADPSQLAVEFAYRYGRYFRGVHWLNLADPSQLEAEIARCGREMRLPNFPEDQPTQVSLTLHTWKSDGPRLLILDNFEEPALTNDVLRLIGHSSLRLLITSRRTDWLATSGLKPLPLEVFTSRESLDYLKRTLTKRHDTDKDLAGLAERLGHLPLALELASRYLNGHPRLSLDDYLTQSREALDHPSMHGWRADLPAPTDHDLDLQRTFALSWNALAGRVGRGLSSDERSEERIETTEKIFLMAGYLAPNTPIPLEIFEKALEISTETCDEALAALYGLGLLKQGETDLPAVHPLLSAYARGLAKENSEILEKLADTLGTLSKKATDTGLPVHFAPFRSHVPTTASHAEEVGLQNAGTLWNNYGYHLKTIADYAGARAAFERALKIDEATFGPDHPSVARDVNNLGGVLKALGDLAGARAAFERALKIFEKQLGEDHPNVAILVNNIGDVLQALGDLAGARAAFERAIKIWEANLGMEHPQVAIGVNNLGGVLQALGDLAGARAAFERALKIFKKFLPPDHPNIKLVQGNLDSLEK